LTRFLDDAAQDFSEAVALDFLGARTTYRALLYTADRFAGALAGLGVRTGDRVAVLLPTCPQHLATLFAAWRLGAIVTEHDPATGDATLERELNEAGCRVVVCLESAYPALERLKGRLPGVAHVVATTLEEALPFHRRPGVRWRARKVATRISRGEGVLRFRNLVERSAPGVGQAPVDVTEDPAVVLFTGARSGAGVTLTHANLVANAFQVRLWLPDVQAGREVVLAALPLRRAYGLTTCALQGVLSAATLVLLPWLGGRDVRWATSRKPTILFGDPPLYTLLAADQGRRPRARAADPGLARTGRAGKGRVRGVDLPSLRVCLSGDGELSEPVARGIERRTGGKLREGWGLTECSPVTHANPVYGRARPGTAGLPLPDTVCWLADPGDPARQVPPGATGELLVAGPQVMKGYWNRPEETAAAFVDGWLRTRTLARTDGDGYCTIVGRMPATR
jgi:long-chain acyl-CoA synthetase